MKSCDNSNEALELSKQDFIGERKLILKGEFNKNNTAVAIKSSNSNSLIQNAGITFPTEFNVPEIIIRESDSTISLLPIRNKLKQQLRELYKTSHMADYVKLPLAYIPVRIETAYVAKGFPEWDVSLYLIDYSAIISDNPNIEPEINFHGIIKSNDEIDLKRTNNIDNKSLDEMWEASKRSLQKRFQTNKQIDK